jgi:hypothetical protein
MSTAVYCHHVTIKAPPEQHFDVCQPKLALNHQQLNLITPKRPQPTNKPKIPSTRIISTILHSNMSIVFIIMLNSCLYNKVDSILSLLCSTYTQISTQIHKHWMLNSRYLWTNFITTYGWIFLQQFHVQSYNHSILLLYFAEPQS